MSKFQIEKVMHSEIYSENTCCVIDYFKSSDSLLQTNYCEEESARNFSFHLTVGIWRIKSLKNN